MLRALLEGFGFGPYSPTSSPPPPPPPPGGYLPTQDGNDLLLHEIQSMKRLCGAMERLASLDRLQGRRLLHLYRSLRACRSKMKKVLSESIDMEIIIEIFGEDPSSPPSSTPTPFDERDP